MSPCSPALTWAHKRLPGAFSAEAANLSGLEHGQALLDLVKAFETVPHHVLVEAAKVKGYPMAILKLSIAA